MTGLDRITSDPMVMGGKACVRGMRITVSFVLRMLASGMNKEDILRDHPALEASDIEQCVKYAALLADERVLPIPA